MTTNQQATLNLNVNQKIIFYTLRIYIQWAPLNGITDNGINRIIESLLGPLVSPISQRNGLFIGKSISVNSIFRLLGSDMLWPKVIPFSSAYCILYIFPQIDCVVKLSGMPDLSMSFMNPRMFDDTSFHPCVRFKRWEVSQHIFYFPC